MIRNLPFIVCLVAATLFGCSFDEGKSKNNRSHENVDAPETGNKLISSGISFFTPGSGLKLIEISGGRLGPSESAKVLMPKVIYQDLAGESQSDATSAVAIKFRFEDILHQHTTGQYFIGFGKGDFEPKTGVPTTALSRDSKGFFITLPKGSVITRSRTAGETLTFDHMTVSDSTGEQRYGYYVKAFLKIDENPEIPELKICSITETYGEFGYLSGCPTNVFPLPIGAPVSKVDPKLIEHNLERNLTSRFFIYDIDNLKNLIFLLMDKKVPVTLNKESKTATYIDIHNPASICQNIVAHFDDKPDEDLSGLLVTSLAGLNGYELPNLYNDFERHALRCDFKCKYCQNNGNVGDLNEFVGARHELVAPTATFKNFAKDGEVVAGCVARPVLNATCSMFGSLQVASDKKSADLTVYWTGGATGTERISYATLNDEEVDLAGSRTYGLGSGSVPERIEFVLHGENGSVKACEYVSNPCWLEEPKQDSYMNVSISGAQDSFTIMQVISRQYAVPPMGWLEHQLSGFGSLNHEKKVPIHQLYGAGGCLYEKAEEMRYYIGQVTAKSKISEREGNDIYCGGDFGDTIQIYNLFGVVRSSDFTVEADLVLNQQAKKYVSYENRNDVYYFCGLSTKQTINGENVALKYVPSFLNGGPAEFGFQPQVNNTIVLAYINPTYNNYPLSLKMGWKNFYPTDFQKGNCVEGIHPEHCLYPIPRNQVREIDIIISKE